MQTNDSGHVDVPNGELARMLVAAEALPKLDEAGMVAICTSRGWSVDSQPKFREIAEVFFAEGCSAQRGALTDELDLLAPRMVDGLVINHDEAQSFAHILKNSSNLARCYLELHAILTKAGAV